MTSPTADHDDVVHAFERWLIRAEDAGDELRSPLFPAIVLSVTRVFLTMRQPEPPLRGQDHFHIPNRPESSVPCDVGRLEP